MIRSSFRSCVHDRVLVALVERLGPYTRSGEEYRFDCPYCEHHIKTKDTRQHLYFNLDLTIKGETGWFHCFRCNSKGSVKRVLGNDYFTGNAIVTDQFKRLVLSSLAATADSQAVRPAKSVSLPLDYHEVFEGTKAHRYLCSRGISDDLIGYYRLGFGAEDLRQVEIGARHLYAGSGRIVFPDFDNSENVIYWVARSYVDHVAKYKNCKSYSRDQLYWFHGVDKSEPVVITEGPISAIRAGRNAIATYGKSVTKEQISKLLSSSVRQFVVALDGDARKESFKLASVLHSNGKEVRLVDFGMDEDPASVDDMSDRIRLANVFGNHSIAFLL